MDEKLEGGTLEMPEIEKGNYVPLQKEADWELMTPKMAQEKKAAAEAIKKEEEEKLNSHQLHI